MKLRLLAAAADGAASSAAGSGSSQPEPAIDVTLESRNKLGLQAKEITDPEVAKALQRVQAALAEAEHTIQVCAGSGDAVG